MATNVMNINLTGSSEEKSNAVTEEFSHLLRSPTPDVLLFQTGLSEDGLRQVLGSEYADGRFEMCFAGGESSSESAAVCWNSTHYVGQKIDWSSYLTYFPLLKDATLALVNLWSIDNAKGKASGTARKMSFTAVSFSSLTYDFNMRARLKVLETLIKFLMMLRQEYKYELRILVGGKFNLDLRSFENWHYPHFVPLLHQRMPGSGPDVKNTFLFTKDFVRVVDYTFKSVDPATIPVTPIAVRVDPSCNCENVNESSYVKGQQEKLKNDLLNISNKQVTMMKNAFQRRKMARDTGTEKTSSASKEAEVSTNRDHDQNSADNGYGYSRPRSSWKSNKKYGPKYGEIRPDNEEPFGDQGRRTSDVGDSYDKKEKGSLSSTKSMMISRHVCYPYSVPKDENDILEGRRSFPSVDYSPGTSDKDATAKRKTVRRARRSYARIKSRRAKQNLESGDFNVGSSRNASYSPRRTRSNSGDRSPVRSPRRQREDEDDKDDHNDKLFHSRKSERKDKYGAKFNGKRRNKSNVRKRLEQMKNNKDQEQQKKEMMDKIKRKNDLMNQMILHTETRWRKFDNKPRNNPSEEEISDVDEEVPTSYPENDELNHHDKYESTHEDRPNHENEEEPANTSERYVLRDKEYLNFDDDQEDSKNPFNNSYDNSNHVHFPDQNLNINSGYRKEEFPNYQHETTKQVGSLGSKFNREINDENIGLNEHSHETNELSTSPRFYESNSNDVEQFNARKNYDEPYKQAASYLNQKSPRKSDTDDYDEKTDQEYLLQRKKQNLSSFDDLYKSRAYSNQELQPNSNAENSRENKFNDKKQNEDLSRLDDLYNSRAFSNRELQSNLSLRNEDNNENIPKKLINPRKHIRRRNSIFHPKIQDLVLH